MPFAGQSTSPMLWMILSIVAAILFIGLIIFGFILPKLQKDKPIQIDTGYAQKAPPIG